MRKREQTMMSEREAIKEFTELYEQTSSNETRN